MSDTAGDIQRQIRHGREALDAQLHELHRKVTALADWRGHYRKSPTLFLAVAFAAGLLLAATRRRRSWRTSRHPDMLF